MAGFAGSHLADYLVANTDWTIFGFDRPGVSRCHLQQCGDRVHCLEVDLLDATAVQDAYRQVQPDYVFHLAGQASVAQSWAHPWQTFEANVRAQMNLFDAAVKLGQPQRALAIGSADEYGSASLPGVPLSENAPLLPANPYGVSKVAQDLLAYQYFRGYGLPVVRVRPFNHIGPRQNEGFVASSFARQIVEAELGLREPSIQVGNLEARRDFCDVRDVVRAYFLALTAGLPGEVYNIGSGRAIAIGELLRILLEMARCRVTVHTDPNLLRPSDAAEVLCDSRRLREQTGWVPEISIERTLADLLAYWRDRLQSKSTH